MRYIFRLALTLAMSFSAVAFAGDIQVSCEPGLRVYLDGALMGVSSAKDDGLFLAGVKNGRHTVRIEKDGFVPQSYELDVAESPIEVKVERPVPAVLTGPRKEADVVSVRRPLATLVITSAPQNCTVEIDGRAETKTAPELVIDDIAAGEHRISFSKQGYDPISGVARLHPGTRVTVRGDLIAGKVETIYEGKGSLRLFSKPEHCAVRILGMTREKTHAVLNLAYLPAGEHLMIVSCKGRTTSSNILIMDRQRTIVKVDLLTKGQPLAISYEPE